MKKFYQFTLAIVIMFALTVSISHLAVAQGKVNIKDGSL